MEGGRAEDEDGDEDRERTGKQARYIQILNINIMRNDAIN